MLKMNSAVKSSQTEFIAKIALAGIFAVLVSKSTIAGINSPLNVSLAASINPVYSIAVFVGSLFAYLFSGDFSNSVNTICALLLVVVIRFFVYHDDKKDSSIKSAITSASCMLVSGSFFIFISDNWKNMLFIHVCISVLCGLAAYFITEVINSLKANGTFELNGTAGCSLAVVFVLLVATISSISVSVFNMGRILGILTILVAARKYRNFGGGLCGILTSSGAMLYSAKLGSPTIMLAASGLITGLFYELNNFVFAFFFIAVNAVSMLAIGVNETSLRFIMDVLAASALYTVLPVSSFSNVFERRSKPHLRDTSLTALRLEFASDIISDIRKSTLEISNLLEKRSNELKVTDTIFNKVCGACRNRDYCWGRIAKETAACFEELKKLEKIDPDDLPSLLDKCYKKQELIKELNYRKSSNEYCVSSWAHLRETQGIIFDLMQTSEEILCSVSGRVSRDIRFDSDAAKLAEIVMEDNGIENPQACVYINENRMFIEAYCKNTEKPDALKIRDELSIELDRELPVYDVVYTDRGARLFFAEQAEFSADFGASQRSAIGDNVSGDNYDYFYDSNGFAYLAVSDGMGTGKEAALDSRLCISMLKRLIFAGIDCETAIKLINTSMLVKSCEESFASLDVAKINLSTGETTLIKSGASATLIKSGDKVLCIKAASFPIGIVSNAEPFYKTVSLQKGDMIILLSDGVDEEFYPIIKTLLLADEMQEAEKLSEEICKAVSCKIKMKRSDDITAAIAVLK